MKVILHICSFDVVGDRLSSADKLCCLTAVCLGWRFQAVTYVADMMIVGLAGSAGLTIRRLLMLDIGVLCARSSRGHRVAQATHRVRRC